MLIAFLPRRQCHGSLQALERSRFSTPRPTTDRRLGVARIPSRAGTASRTEQVRSKQYNRERVIDSFTFNWLSNDTLSRNKRLVWCLLNTLGIDISYCKTINYCIPNVKLPATKNTLLTNSHTNIPVYKGINIKKFWDSWHLYALNEATSYH